MRLFWFLALSSIGLLLAIIVAGFIYGHNPMGRDDRGYPVVELLASLSYIDYVEAESTGSGDGVVHYDERMTQTGFNLFTYKAVDKIFLMSMDGAILYELDISESCNLSYIMKYDDGGFMVICESEDILGKGLVKLSFNGSLMWRSYAPVHHDYAIADNGDVYSLTINDITDEVNPFGVISLRDNPIIIFNGSGSTKHTISSYDILKKTLGGQITSFLRDALHLDSTGAPLDVLHINAVKIIRSDNGIFEAGYVLVSSRHLDTIAVLDLEKKEVVWSWGPGEIEGQHYPHMLPNGNILLFDNGVYRNYSRVIELNPHTEEIVWEYNGNNTNRFFTRNAGRAVRLENDNILVVERDKGRVFEVTRGGVIVWEYLVPREPDSRRPIISSMQRVNMSTAEKIIGYEC